MRPEHELGRKRMYNFSCQLLATGFLPFLGCSTDQTFEVMVFGEWQPMHWSMLPKSAHENGFRQHHEPRPRMQPFAASQVE